MAVRVHVDYMYLHVQVSALLLARRWAHSSPTRWAGSSRSCSVDCRWLSAGLWSSCLATSSSWWLGASSPGSARVWDTCCLRSTSPRSLQRLLCLRVYDVHVNIISAGLNRFKQLCLLHTFLQHKSKWINDIMYSMYVRSCTLIICLYVAEHVVIRGNVNADAGLQSFDSFPVYLSS